MASIEKLLTDLVQGTLTAEAAATQLEQTVRAYPMHHAVLMTRVQSDIAANRISHVAGRLLLSAIERGARPQTAASSADRTAAMGERTAVQGGDQTLVKQPTRRAAVFQEEPTRNAGGQQSDATAQEGSRGDRTQIDEDVTSLRPAAPAPGQTTDDETRLPPGANTVALHGATATLRMNSDAAAPDVPGAVGATLKMPGAVPSSDPDATLASPRAGSTAARTLQAATATEVLPVTGATDGLGKTHVITDRLVQSLDEADIGHRGPLQPGSIIKRRFVLETLIGRGGMGLVFSAIDRRKEEAQDPNPRVALKVLNADFERHPQSFMALQREARKAQTLAHPNVVTVFDFDRDGDTVYMTMELLQGKPLEAIAREARGKGVDRETALPIIRGIAEGLAYAHRKGIVHSDLKPGNVFIAADGTAKILDFGIARAVPSTVDEENKDVFDAGSLGAYTEAYATDEMVDGIDPHPADDMYALGIIGYELLTGFHPYQRHGAPTARKMGLQPVQLKGMKRREAKALERCVSLDRKDRPQDASEFLKMFRGAGTVQKASLAAAVVLAIVSGYLWYDNYLETGPAVAFSQLPAQTQQQFRDAMSEGEKAWSLYEAEKFPGAVDDSIQFYARAYNLHPRNREAVAALKKSADEFLKLHGSSAEERREAAEFLQGQTDYFRKYAPVVDAAK